MSRGQPTTAQQLACHVFHETGISPGLAHPHLSLNTSPTAPRRTSLIRNSL